MKDKFQEGFPPFSGNQNKNYDGAKKAFEDAILGMDPSKTKDLKPEQDAAPQEKVPFYEHNIIKETVLPILQRLEESFGLTDENIEELLGYSLFKFYKNEYQRALGRYDNMEDFLQKVPIAIDTHIVKKFSSNNACKFIRESGGVSDYQFLYYGRKCMPHVIKAFLHESALYFGEEITINITDLGNEKEQSFRFGITRKK